MPGKIIMGGFSIGNYLDVPSRVVECIDTVDIVAVEWEAPFVDYCEKINKFPKKLIQYNGLMNNYKELTNMLISEVKNEKTILFLVDGGMPCVSDPGDELAIAARENNIEIVSIPGPSIVTSAISISGINSHRFIFEPEIPEKKSDRLRIFKFYEKLPHTAVFIANRNSEASRYTDGILNESFLLDTLIDMSIVFGMHRKVALCFNITMDNEFIFRGSIKESIDWSKKNKNNGMLTIVVEGYHGVFL